MLQTKSINIGAMIPSRRLFVLSENTPFSTGQEAWAAQIGTAPAWWQTATHAAPVRPGLMIRAGCQVAFSLPPIAGDLSLLLTIGAGLPQISSDGLDAYLAIREPASELLLFSYHIGAFHPSQPWQEFSFPVRFHGAACELIVGCTPGPRSDPHRDWLALYELVISPEAQLGLHRGRAYREHRLRNEIQVINHAYDHPIYRIPDAPEPVAANATELSNVLLGQRIGRPVPDFTVLLHRKLAAKGRLRVLSLASGVARVETQMLQNIQPGLIDLTLTDINPELLARARPLFAPHEIRTAVVDLNSAILPEEHYDIILCVSGLHHIVELESLIDAIAARLKPDGEFWVIGEYVGRTGARLWDDAYHVANQYFRALPERCRFNSVFQRVDAELPNTDCSVASFEGIRSEEVAAVLASRFEAEWTDKRCCIIWRLFDSLYSSNYDMAASGDRSLIRRAVDLDYDLMQKRSRPVNLNAVYRLKNSRFRLPSP
jgi:SAM-dependent methyltransferase